MTKLDETWRKSTRSGTNGACVEVRKVGGSVQLRDTKGHGYGPVITFAEAQWGAFVEGVKDDEFSL